MKMRRSKWIMLAVAICFAVLQMLQPFIHGHLDFEHHVDHSGFHVGNDHEEGLDASHHENNHVISNIEHPSHTVSVASGIKEEFNPVFVSDVASALLLMLYFVILLISKPNTYFSLDFLPYLSLKRRLPLSRAPPQY